jgi:hypothetical protein
MNFNVVVCFQVQGTGSASLKCSCQTFHAYEAADRNVDIKRHYWNFKLLIYYWFT